LFIIYPNFAEQKAVSHADHINLLAIDDYLDNMETTEMTMEQSRSCNTNVERRISKEKANGAPDLESYKKPKTQLKTLEETPHDSMFLKIKSIFNSKPNFCSDSRLRLKVSQKRGRVTDVLV
jgi:hypothetical protein